jgi:hypothetical protein
MFLSNAQSDGYDCFSACSKYVAKNSIMKSFSGGRGEVVSLHIRNLNISVD